MIVKEKGVIWHTTLSATNC